MSKTQGYFGEQTPSVAELDAVDAQILALLLKDARQSARSIAKQVGRSPGAILERISRLEREGIIRGYSAFIDLARLGIGMTAIVGVEVDDTTPLSELVQRIQGVPECERVYVVTGNWDLLVQVRVRDQDHLSQVLFGKLWGLGGFRHTQTMLVLYRATSWDGYLPTLLEEIARRAQSDDHSVTAEIAPKMSRASGDGNGRTAARGTAARPK